MIYIYRRSSSSGARLLSEAIPNARRWRAATVPIEQKVRRGDVIVCWGEAVPAIPGVTVLNGAPLQNKLQDALKLKQAGVPTIETSTTRPTVVQPPAQDTAPQLFNDLRGTLEDFLDVEPTINLRNNRVFEDGLDVLIRKIQVLQNTVRTPLAPAGPPQPDPNWLPRLRNHVGGNDLLSPPATPDFFVKKENIVEEFRVHSFNGKSIRAGKKEHREGFAQPHPWIRSWDGGWRILYDGVSAKQKHRDLAHAAVNALGLTFGAVDIGVKDDGSLIVLEVNRAPGLEGGTVDRYATAIQQFVAGGQ